MCEKTAKLSGMFRDSIDKGILGDNYELVGIYHEGFDAESDSDLNLEIFIVSVRSEV